MNEYNVQVNLDFNTRCDNPGYTTATIYSYESNWGTTPMQFYADPDGIEPYNGLDLYYLFGTKWKQIPSNGYSGTQGDC